MTVRRTRSYAPRPLAVIVVLAERRPRSEFTRKMLAAGFKPWWPL